MREDAGPEVRAKEPLIDLLKVCFACFTSVVDPEASLHPQILRLCVHLGDRMEQILEARVRPSGGRTCAARTGVSRNQLSNISVS